MEIITSKKLIFHLFILIFTVSSTFSQPNFATQSCSSDIGNYTTNSPFKQNLDNLLSSVTSSRQLMDSGFHNSSSGQEPDKVNLIALCRGDFSVQDCVKCINDSRIKILEVCPNQKEAIGWYNDCMIRYSNASIFGGVSRVRVLTFLSNTRNASDQSGFTQALRNLMDRLRQEAASGDSIRKFAVGEIAAPGFDSIYGLVQCTPDLSSIDCNNCIIQLTSLIPAVGRSSSLGARIFATSCNLRYEIQLFFNFPAPPPRVDSGLSPPPLLPPTQGG